MSETTAVNASAGDSAGPDSDVTGSAATSAEVAGTASAAPPPVGDAVLVTTADGRHYLRRAGSLYGIGDQQTWCFLQAVGLQATGAGRALQREHSVADDDATGNAGAATVDVAESVGPLDSMAGNQCFYVEDSTGERRTLWAHGGDVFDVTGLSELDREDVCGPAVPVESAYPGLGAAFAQAAGVPLSLTTNQQEILTYLRTIPPPSVTAAPGLTITPTGGEVPHPYTAPENVRYQVTAQDQQIQNVLDSFPVVAPVADAIWPGAIVQSRTIASGQLGLVQIADRAAGTLTVTTEVIVSNSSAPTSTTVASPSAASVTTARRQMLHAMGPTASTGNVDLEVGTVTTEQQVSARLGAKVSGSSWNASADVSVSGSLETSRSFVKLTQEFYTVVFEPTGSPAWLFGPNVDVGTVRQYCGPGNAPAYVSQVTYGRVVLMAIDSADSALDVETQVKAMWKATVSGEVDEQSKLKDKTSSYHVHIATVGTTGATVFKAAQGLKEAIAELAATANYSEQNPGAVIAFSLRYLLDGTLARAVVGPYRYTALVRSDLPQTAVSYGVYDGDKGVQGGVRTGVTLRCGDHVAITALGHVWAGWIFGSWFGPEGDTSDHGKQMGNGTKPLTGVAYSALIYGFGQGWYYWADNPSFTFGVDHPKNEPDGVTIGSPDTSLPLFVHLNDNDVRNGRGGFTGQIIVQRRPLPAVGPR